MSHLKTCTSDKQVWELVDGSLAKQVIFFKERSVSIGFNEDHETLEKVFTKIVRDPSISPLISDDGGNSAELFLNKTDGNSAYCRFTNGKGESVSKKLSLISFEETSFDNVGKLHDFAIDHFSSTHDANNLIDIISQFCALLASPFIFLYELLAHPFDPIKDKTKAIASLEGRGQVSYKAVLRHIDFTKEILEETFGKHNGDEPVDESVAILETAKILGEKLERTSHVTDTASKKIIEELSADLSARIQNGEKILLPINFEEQGDFSPTFLLFLPEKDGNYLVHRMNCLPPTALPKGQKHIDIQSWRVPSTTFSARYSMDFFRNLLRLHKASSSHANDDFETRNILSGFFEENITGTEFKRAQPYATPQPYAVATKDPLESLFSAMKVLHGDIDIFSTRAKFYHAIFQKFLSYVGKNDDLLSAEERINALQGLKFYAERTKEHLEKELGTTNAELIIGSVNRDLAKKLKNQNLSKTLAEDQRQALNQRMVKFEGKKLRHNFQQPGKVEVTLQRQAVQSPINAIGASNYENLNRVKTAFREKTHQKFDSVLANLEVIKNDAQALLDKGNKQGAEQAKILLTATIKLLPIEEPLRNFWFDIPHAQLNDYSAVIGAISEQYFRSITGSDRTLMNSEELFSISPRQKFELITLQLITDLFALRKLGAATDRFNQEFERLILSFDFTTNDFRDFFTQVRAEIVTNTTAAIKVQMFEEEDKELRNKYNSLRKENKKISLLKASLKRKEAERKKFKEKLDKGFKNPKDLFGLYFCNTRGSGFESLINQAKYLGIYEALSLRDLTQPQLVEFIKILKVINDDLPTDRIGAFLQSINGIQPGTKEEKIRQLINYIQNANYRSNKIQCLNKNGQLFFDFFCLFNKVSNKEKNEICQQVLYDYFDVTVNRFFEKTATVFPTNHNFSEQIFEIPSDRPETFEQVEEIFTQIVNQLDQLEKPEFLEQIKGLQDIIKQSLPDCQEKQDLLKIIDQIKSPTFLCKENLLKFKEQLKILYDFEFTDVELCEESWKQFFELVNLARENNDLIKKFKTIITHVKNTKTLNVNQEKDDLLRNIEQIFNSEKVLIEASLKTAEAERDCLQARIDLLNLLKSDIDRQLIRILIRFLEEKFTSIVDGEVLQKLQVDENCTIATLTNLLSEHISCSHEDLEIFLNKPGSEITYREFCEKLPATFGVLNLFLLFNENTNLVRGIVHFYLGRLLKKIDLPAEILGDYLDALNHEADFKRIRDDDDYLMTRDHTILSDAHDLQVRYKSAMSFHQELIQAHSAYVKSVTLLEKITHTYDYSSDKHPLANDSLVASQKKMFHSEALIHGYHLSNRETASNRDAQRNLAKIHLEYATASVEISDFNSSSPPLVSRQRVYRKKLMIMRHILLNPNNIFTRKVLSSQKLKARPKTITQPTQEVFSKLATNSGSVLKAHANFVMKDIPVNLPKKCGKANNSCIHGCYSPGFALTDPISNKSIYVVEDEHFQVEQAILGVEENARRWWNEVENYSKACFGRRGKACVQSIGDKFSEEAAIIDSLEKQEPSFEDETPEQILADKFLALGTSTQPSPNTIFQILHFLQNANNRALLAKDPTFLERIYYLLYQKDFLNQFLENNKHKLPAYLELFNLTLVALNTVNIQENSVFTALEQNAQAILFVNLFFDSVREWIENNISEENPEYSIISDKIKEITPHSRLRYVTTIFNSFDGSTRQKFGAYLYMIVWSRLSNQISEPIAKDLIKARFILKESRIIESHRIFDYTVNQIWGEEVLNLIVKQGFLPIDHPIPSSILDWICFKNPTKKLTWEKESERGEFAYKATYEITDPSNDKETNTVTLRVDLQSLNGNQIGGLSNLIKESDVGVLPESVRTHKVFTKLFGTNFQTQIKIAPTTGDYDQYSWEDKKKKIEYTVIYHRGTGQVQVIQKLQSGRQYLYAYHFSETDNKNFQIEPTSTSRILLNGARGLPQDFSQIEEIINEKGMWVELTSDGTSIKKNGNVLVALHDQNLQRDALILKVNIESRGTKLFNVIKIREEKISIITIESVHIGHGINRKEVYCGGCFTDMPALQCRELKGVLLLGTNGRLEEIRIPSVLEYDNVFHKEHAENTNLDASSALSLVRGKDKNSNNWFLKGEGQWQWLIDGNDHIEELFGMNWREYVMPLFNTQTKAYKYVIYPYFAILPDSLAQEVTFVKDFSKLISCLGTKGVIDFFEPLVNELIRMNVDGSDAFSDLGSIPFDLMPETLELLLQKIKENLPTSTCISLIMKFLNDDHLESVIPKKKSEDKESHKTKKSFIKNFVEGFLHSLVPHSFILSVGTDKMEKTTHFGFFYLSHIQSLKGNFRQAEKYLKLMKSSQATSDQHSVQEFHRKLMPLMILPRASYFLPESNIFAILKGLEGSEESERFEPIIKSLLQIFTADRGVKETAFRLKQIFAVLKVSINLSVSHHVNILGENASTKITQVFLHLYATILYSDYQKTIKKYPQALRDEELNLTEEEENLISTIYHFFKSQVLNALDAEKETHWIMKNPAIQEYFQTELVSAKQAENVYTSTLIRFECPVPTEDELEQLAFAIDDLRGDRSITTIDEVHKTFRKLPTAQNITTYFPLYLDWVLNEVTDESELSFLTVPLHTLRNPATHKLNTSQETPMLTSALVKVYMNHRKATHTKHVDTARRVLIYLVRMKKEPSQQENIRKLKLELKAIKAEMVKDKRARFSKFHEKMQERLHTFFRKPNAMTALGFLYEKWSTNWQRLELEPDEQGLASLYRQKLMDFFSQTHKALSLTPSIHEKEVDPEDVSELIFDFPPSAEADQNQIENKPATAEDIVEVIKNAIRTAVSLGEFELLEMIVAQMAKEAGSSGKGIKNVMPFIMQFVQPYFGTNNDLEHLFSNKIIKELISQAAKKLFVEMQPETTKANNSMILAAKAFTAWSSKQITTSDFLLEVVPLIASSANLPQNAKFLRDIAEKPQLLVELTTAIESVYMPLEAQKIFQVIRKFITDQMLQDTAQPEEVRQKKAEEQRKIDSIIVPIYERYSKERLFFENSFTEPRVNIFELRCQDCTEKLSNSRSKDPQEYTREENLLKALEQKKADLSKQLKKSSLLHYEQEVLTTYINNLIPAKEQRAKIVAKDLLNLAYSYQKSLGQKLLFLDESPDRDQRILHTLFELYEEGELSCLNNIELQGKFEELITEYLFLLIEIQQLAKAQVVLSKLKAIKESKPNSEDLQEILDADPEWLLLGIELKVALMRGNDRYRFCKYNDNPNDTTHPLNGEKPRMDEPNFTRRYLVKEYKNGIVSREKALEALELLLHDFVTAINKKDPVQYVYVHMGIGKTTFIIPLLASICVDHKKDAVVMTTNELVDQLHAQLGNDAFRFTFDNKFGLSLRKGAQPEIKATIRHLKNLLQVLGDLKKNKKFVVTTPSDRASLRNKIVELEDQKLFVKAFTGRLAPNQGLLFVQLQLLLKVEQFFKKKDTVTIQDEDINDVSFEFNKATGKVTRKIDRTVYHTAEKITHEMMKCPLLFNKLLNNSLMEIPLPSTTNLSPSQIYDIIADLLDHPEKSLNPILDSILHAQAYLVLKILRDKEYWTRPIRGGSLTFQGAGFSKEQDEYNRVIRKNEKKIFEYIFSHGPGNNNAQILEGVLPQEGFDVFNPEHDKYRFIAALNMFMGDSNAFTAVYKINAKIARGPRLIDPDRETSNKDAALAPEGVEIIPYEDEQEKVGVQYGHELELVLHHLFAYALGESFTSSTLFNFQWKKFSDDIDTSIALAPDVVDALDNEERTRLELIHATNWKEWKENISKVRIAYGLSTDFEAFAAVDFSNTQLNLSKNLAFRGVLAIERLQYLKWAVYSSNRIRIFPEQYVCNSQRIPNEKIFLLSGTGSPFDLNLMRVGEQLQSNELAFAETLLRCDINTPVTTFVDVVAHLESCLENKNCMGAINLDYDMMRGDPTLLITYLRTLDKGKNRQYIWRARNENGEYVKLCWDPGENTQHKPYSADLIKPDIVFYYFPPCDTRGVDFRMPTNNQFLSLLIGLSNDADIVPQGAFRIRELGFGINFVCAIDVKMMKRVCKQHAIDVIKDKNGNDCPKKELRTWEVMMSVWRITPATKEHVHIKAAIFDGKNKIGDRLSRVCETPFDLDNDDYLIIERVNDNVDAFVGRTVGILDQIQKIIFQTTRELFCQKTDIQWVRAFQLQKKYKCMEFLRDLYAQEGRKAEKMHMEFRRRFARMLFMNEKSLQSPYNSLPGKKQSPEDALIIFNSRMNPLINPLVAYKNRYILKNMLDTLLQRPCFQSLYSQQKGTPRERLAAIGELLHTLDTDTIKQLLIEASSHEEMTPFDEVIIDIYLLNNKKLSRYLDSLQRLDSASFLKEINRIAKNSRSLGIFQNINDRSFDLSTMMRACAGDKVLLNVWNHVYLFEQAVQNAKYELLIGEILLGNKEAKQRFENKFTKTLPDGSLKINQEYRSLIIQNLLKTDLGKLIDVYLKSIETDPFKPLPSIEQQIQVVEKHYKTYINDVASTISLTGQEQQVETYREQQQTVQQQRIQRYATQVQPISYSFKINIKKFVNGGDDSSFTRLQFPGFLQTEQMSLAISARSKNIFLRNATRDEDIPALFVVQDMDGKTSACMIGPSDIDNVEKYINALNKKNKHGLVANIYLIYGNLQETFGNKFDLPSFDLIGTIKQRKDQSLVEKTMIVYSLTKFYMGVQIPEYTTAELATIVHTILRNIKEGQNKQGQNQLEVFLRSGFKEYFLADEMMEIFYSRKLVNDITNIWQSLDKSKLSDEEFFALTKETHEKLMNLVLDMRLLYRAENGHLLANLNRLERDRLNFHFKNHNDPGYQGNSSYFITQSTFGMELQLLSHNRSSQENVVFEELPIDLMRMNLFSLQKMFEFLATDNPKTVKQTRVALESKFELDEKHVG